jgi:hypothetical protein
MLGIARRQLLAAGFLLVLLAPAQALAAPVSYTLTGSAGNNGWYRSNVTSASASPARVAASLSLELTMRVEWRALASL